MYFSEENAGRIDYFRATIESWYDGKKINDDEYHYLLACLIESVSFVSNTAGVYGAFLKKWDSRALKPIQFLKVESLDGGNLSLEYHNSKVEEIIAFVRESGGIEYASKKMHAYQEKAINIISEVPDSKVKQALHRLVEYVIERKK